MISDLRLNYLLFALFSFFVGCNSLDLSKVDRQKNVEYNPDSPYFYMTGYYELYANKKPQLIITGEIIYSSLNFKTTDDGFTSNLKTSFVIRDTKNDSVLINETNSLSILVNSLEETKSEQTVSLNKSYNVDHSEYEVSFSVTDSISSKSSSYDFIIDVPLNSENALIIGDIQIQQKIKNDVDSGFKVLSNKNLQNNNDSLKFKYQIINNIESTPVDITGRIIRFESDTSIAESMNSLKPLTPLEVKGIDYSSFEEVYTFTRRLNSSGYLDYEFKIPNLSSGNYRFEVSIVPSAESDLVESSINAYKGIEFGVRSSNFPSLITSTEKLSSLQYLMTKNEFEDLSRITDSSVLDESLIDFWDRKIDNRTISTIIMELYYSRVKEANKRYTNFKEGWKTDLGMVYILFGDPKRIQKNVNTITWIYTDNLVDSERIYTFQTPKQKNRFYPFDNYILNRSDLYFNIQYRQIQKWLNALIPITN